jgi:hypothetical protein
MLYREMIAVCSEIHAEQIALWAEHSVSAGGTLRKS